MIDLSGYETDPAFDELRSTATQLVRGDGKMFPSPDVLFVGEAPGADEDRVGRPFVGKSGYLLDELMADVGMSRREEDARYGAYITNIVKYRPPNNRDPKPEEVKASIPYLAIEVKALKPRVLVTLGRYSLRAVWPDAPSIGRCHGMCRKLKAGLPHMPMYHPAYGIYDPRQRGLLAQDFVKLADLLRSLDEQPDSTTKVSS